MKDRFPLTKQLPELTREQRELLLSRTLPNNHELTDADIKDVMEQVPGGSIRLLQSMAAMITNCARDGGGRRVPPTKEHVLEALDHVRGSEREKEEPAARSGPASTAAAAALVASPAPAAGSSGVTSSAPHDEGHQARGPPLLEPAPPCPPNSCIPLEGHRAR